MGPIENHLKHSIEKIQKTKFLQIYIIGEGHYFIYKRKLELRVNWTLSENVPPDEPFFLKYMHLLWICEHFGNTLQKTQPRYSHSNATYGNILHYIFSSPAYKAWKGNWVWCQIKTKVRTAKKSIERYRISKVISKSNLSHSKLLRKTWFSKSSNAKLQHPY